MSEFKRNKIVEVTWEDTAGYSTWKTPESLEHENGIMVKSIGYLVERNKNHIKICGDWSDQDDIHHATVIPTGCVKKIRRIKNEG